MESYNDREDLDNNVDTDDAFEEMSIEDWVMDKAHAWRNHYESNYEEEFEEYYRLWRAVWDPKDRERDYERSKLISPATQQAVESSVSELEEATFGRGKWFDLVDDADDEDKLDIQRVQKLMQADFNKTKTRKQVSECMINAAVYGTGIAEIVVDEVTTRKPATRPTMDGALTEFGVKESIDVCVTLRPVLPKQFLIEPTATSIEEAVGVIIDEFVPKHQVELLQDSGVYKQCSIGDASPNTNLEPDESIVAYQDDKVRLTKYYGLVPRGVLEEYGADVPEGASRYVEAIVVLANGGIVLKASANPYMMKDRPVVAFQWDVVPGRFWGRGICEKAYMSQKALDTEMRARIDALAIVVHPMMAVDASRLVRGHRPEIRPGKMILTQGPPQEVLQPFNFGNINPASFNQTGELQTMVQQATGAVDSTGLLSNAGDARSGAVSMSLGAVIKRHKRTLINFQETFLIPMVEKVAHRYMQFDPDRYGVEDYTFQATSTLGIIAREYEVSQLIQLLQTMSPDSPLYSALIQSVVENMNLSNREELVAMLKQAEQPSEEEIQAQQAQAAKQMEQLDAQIGVLTSQAQESLARAAKYTAEAEAVPAETEAMNMRAAMEDLQKDNESKDFERRLAILRERREERKAEVENRTKMFKAKTERGKVKSEALQAKRAEKEVMQRIEE